MSETKLKGEEISDPLADNIRICRMLAAIMSHGLAFVLDHDLRFLLADGLGLKESGYTPQDFEGKTFRETLDHDRVERYLPLVERVLHGESFHLEHHDLGREYLSYGVPIRSEGGEVLAALLISYNDTERKQAEEALRQSEEKYRRLFESIDEGFSIIKVLFDENGKPVDYRFLETNPAFERHTGFDGVVGKRVREILPNLEEHWFEAYGRIAVTGEPQRFENPSEQLGRYFDVYAFRLGEPEERKVAVLFKDISDRKQSEGALQESEARFRSLLENSQEVAYRRNMKTDRYDYISPVVKQLLGYDEEEMNAMGTLDVLNHVHLEDRQTLIDQLALANETGSVKLEYRFKNKDGQYRWLSDYLTAVRDQSGKPLYRIGSVRDITRLKETQEALRALNQELEQRVVKRTGELVELQRRFMDGIEVERSLLAREIHDGPMQDIYGLSYRIAGLNLELSTESLQGELTTINQELVKINSTLRGITQELLPPTLATYGLEGAIQSHVDSIRQANSEPNIELDFRQDGKSLDKNTRLALFRIYQNAITNVIRHAQAENVDIRFYKDDENYYLEVRDDGVGFEAPESWIDFARSGHLGLASTHERAQAIGGRMEIYSRPGKGTLVRVVVPGERGLGKPATGVREQ